MCKLAAVRTEQRQYKEDQNEIAHSISPTGTPHECVVGRRSVGWLRAAADTNADTAPADTRAPDADTRSSHADARAELERYRAETASPEDFLRMAGKYSEDEPSRRRQGVLGWVHADEPGVDPALCAAAFAASPGEVSGPFRTAQGEALVLVLDVRPPPAEERFREEVRRSLHARLRQEFLAEHGLRTAFQGRN